MDAMTCAMDAAHVAGGVCVILEFLRGTCWPVAQGLTSLDLPDTEALFLHHACLMLQHVVQGFRGGWTPQTEMET
jgi:hypothetical protein